MKISRYLSELEQLQQMDELLKLEPDVQKKIEAAAHNIFFRVTGNFYNHCKNQYLGSLFDSLKIFVLKSLKNPDMASCQENIHYIAKIYQQKLRNDEKIREPVLNCPSKVKQDLADAIKEFEEQRFISCESKWNNISKSQSQTNKVRCENFTHRLNSLTLQFEIMRNVASYLTTLLKYRKIYLEATQNEFNLFHLGPEGMLANFDSCHSIELMATLLQIQKTGDSARFSRISYENKQAFKKIKQSPDESIKKIAKLYLNFSKLSPLRKIFYDFFLALRKDLIRLNLFQNHFEVENNPFAVSPLVNEIFLDMKEIIVSQMKRENHLEFYTDEYLYHPSSDQLQTLVQNFTTWYRDILPSHVQEFKEIWQSLEKNSPTKTGKMAFTQNFLSNNEFAQTIDNKLVRITSDNRNQIKNSSVKAYFILEVKEYLKKIEEFQEYLQKTTQPESMPVPTIGKVIAGGAKKTSHPSKPPASKSNKKKSRKRQNRKQAKISTEENMKNEKSSEDAKILKKQLDFGEQKIDYEIEDAAVSKINTNSNLKFRKRVTEWYDKDCLPLQKPPYETLSHEKKVEAYDKHTLSPLFKLLIGTDYSLNYDYTDPKTGKIIKAHCFAINYKSGINEYQGLAVISGEPGHHFYLHDLTNSKLLETISAIRDKVLEVFKIILFPSLSEVAEIQAQATKNKIVSFSSKELEQIKLGVMDTLTIENVSKNRTYTVYKLNN